MSLLKAFTPEQIKALEEHFAEKGHNHTSDQIIVDTEDGQTLESMIEDMEDDEDDEDDEEED